MNALWERGEAKTAFAASSHMDDLGLTAWDEIGRRYSVFNVVLQQDGLLFCVVPA